MVRLSTDTLINTHQCMYITLLTSKWLSDLTIAVSTPANQTIIATCIHDVRSNTDRLNCENDKVLIRLGP